jgi:hypothetical protein
MEHTQPNKAASAYRFADRIVLHSQARTPAWFYIACEPYLRLSREASPEEVGRAVRSALDGYRPDIPQPSDLKQVTAAFVRGLGARSNKQIQQSSICCGIRDQEGQLVFEPTHNGGTRGDAKGFQPTKEGRVSVRADAPAAEIGAALLRGFDLCTTIYESA